MITDFAFKTGRYARILLRDYHFDRGPQQQPYRVANPLQLPSPCYRDLFRLIYSTEDKRRDDFSRCRFHH